MCYSSLIVVFSVFKVTYERTSLIRKGKVILGSTCPFLASRVIFELVLYVCRIWHLRSNGVSDVHRGVSFKGANLNNLIYKIV